MITGTLCDAESGLHPSGTLDHNTSRNSNEMSLRWRGVHVGRHGRPVKNATLALDTLPAIPKQSNWPTIRPGSFVPAAATGSGVTAGNLALFAPHADALIVGSSLKHEGKWSNPVDSKRVKALVTARG